MKEVFMYSSRIVKPYILVLLLFIASLPLKAQVLPVMAYGGQEDERAFALVEATNQTGYVLAGWTKSFGASAPAFSNVLIVKTDTLGIPQWSRVSVGLFDDEAHSMVHTSDGGYAITGWTRSFGPGHPDSLNIFVVKIDAAGVWQWGWVYGSPFSEEAHSIIQTMDGGYALTGWTNLITVNPTVRPNIFLLKLDPMGVPMWTGIYWFPMNLEDEGYSLAEIPIAGGTAGYLIAGRAKVFNPTNFDAFVMQTDPQGMPVSLASIVPGPGEDEAYSVLWGGQTFMAAGWSNSFSVGTDADIIVWEDDTVSGTPVIFADHFGWSNDEKVMDDRSLIGFPGYWRVCGWTHSVGPGIPNPNFLIIDYDTSGFSGRVHPSAPGANAEQAYPMTSVSVADARFAIAGFTNSFGQGGDDFHLLTLDGALLRPECVIDTMPPHDSIFVLQEPVMGEPNYLEQFEPFPLEDTMVMYTRICTLQTGVMELPKEELKDDSRISVSFEKVTLQIGHSGWLVSNLYDITGRKVASLAQGMYEAGTHSLVLPKNIGTGVYFVRVEFDGVVKSTKVIRYR
jgi:hypothetical protein